MSDRVLAALILVLLLAAACGEPVATEAPVQLQLAGSTSMVGLGQELAEAYAAGSGAVVNVTAYGTQSGLAALEAGDAQIALVSWLPQGLGPQWRSTLIARDAIAVIVHPSNPVDGLSLAQVQALFAGRASEWLQAGGRAQDGMVQPVSREEGSGTRSAFEALATGSKRPTSLSLVVPSTQAVVDYVAAHRAAIGYVSWAAVSPRVKALAVEGELPSQTAAETGTYPLVRDLWLVTARDAPHAVSAFLDWAVGTAGQLLVGVRFVRVQKLE